MNYITLTASKPGNPAPKVEKRTSEERIYWIDCSSLVASGELISGTITHKAPDDINVSDTRTRQGKYLQFKVSGGPATMPFVEYQIRFNVGTTAQNIISIPLVIKVYSD